MTAGPRAGDAGTSHASGACGARASSADAISADAGLLAFGFAKRHLAA